MLDGCCNFLSSIRAISLEKGIRGILISSTLYLFQICDHFSPGDSRSNGPGMEPKAARSVCRNLSFSFLASRPLVRRCGGRPSAGQCRWSSAFLSLGHTTRILECSVGESLCQVSGFCPFTLRAMHNYFIHVGSFFTSSSCLKINQVITISF